MRRPGGYGPVRDDYPRNEPAEPRSWAARNRAILAVVGAFVLVLAAGTGGWALLSPGSDPGSRSAVNDTGADPSTTTVGPPTTTPPAPTTPAAPRTSASKKVLPKPTVTVKPPAKEIPPPPATQPPNTGCTAPTYAGTNAPTADVRDALVAAGNYEYWQGVVLPANLTVPLPKITVPAELMKAIAWQESGWQSAIVACDGGIGTMQLMDNTVTSTNTRFGTTYDVHTLAGNTQLGAEYVEWLIMFFGTVTFSQNFALDTVAAVGPNGSNLTLLQAVTEAYNVGPYAILNADNTIKYNDKAVQYSNNVIALMKTCPCLSL